MTHNPPLAPHEIDQLPNAARIFATIDQIRDEADESVQFETEELTQLVGETESDLRRALNILTELIEVCEGGNLDAIGAQAEASRSLLDSFAA